MSSETSTPEQWLLREDRACFNPRAERLMWLLSKTPAEQIWTFPGGWLARQLFEEARYCFVYGQFLATAVVGFAFIEKTLAAMFYTTGRNDLKRATGEQLAREALSAGWITEAEFHALEKSRQTRNPLVHFRTPLHRDQPDIRALELGDEPDNIVERDAKHILEAVFRLLARNAVG